MLTLQEMAKAATAAGAEKAEAWKMEGLLCVSVTFAGRKPHAFTWKANDETVTAKEVENEIRFWASKAA